MPGRFAVLKHGTYPLDVPSEVIAEALGFTGPDDLLVFVKHSPPPTGKVGPGVAQEEPRDLDGPPVSPGVRSNYVVRNEKDVQSDQALKAGDQHRPGDDALGGPGAGQGEADEVVDDVHELVGHVPAAGATPASYTARSTTPIGSRAALPATLQDIEQSRAAAATPTSAQHLGLRLPSDAHGVVFADIQSRAAAMRCKATLVYGGEVLLESALGRWYCKSFAEACQRLNGTL